MKAFLDANVLFSAAYGTQGQALRLWPLHHNGLVSLATSELAIQEARRNMAAKEPDGLLRLEPLVAQLEIVEAAQTDYPTWNLSSEDAELLASAIACGATHFVTRDKDFDLLKNRDDLGIRVATIRDFLEELTWHEKEKG